jgi:hypothetical protein
VQNTSKANDKFIAAVQRGASPTDAVRGGGRFLLLCRDTQGQLKWQAETQNLVVNVGLKDMNDKYFAGSGYTATWFLGLYGVGASNNPAAGDTAASHAGWVESTAYSNATRPACVFGAATAADPSVVSNTASPAVFNMNGAATIGGAFLISNSTKGGTTGILFSAADFGAPGDRVVVNGDTLTLTYSFSLDAV